MNKSKKWALKWGIVLFLLVFSGCVPLQIMFGLPFLVSQVEQSHSSQPVNPYFESRIKQKIFYISVDSSITDAIIYLNNEKIGKTPAQKLSVVVAYAYSRPRGGHRWQYNGITGKYWLQVRKDGYASDKEALEFTGAETPNARLKSREFYFLMKEVKKFEEYGTELYFERERHEDLIGRVNALKQLVREASPDRRYWKNLHSSKFHPVEKNDCVIIYAENFFNEIVSGSMFVNPFGSSGKMAVVVRKDAPNDFEIIVPSFDSVDACEFLSEYQWPDAFGVDNYCDNNSGWGKYIRIKFH